MASLFFFYFATVIVVTSFLVVALRNPVHSVLSLLLMFFHVAGLYVTLHAEFLAAVQIIVYAGAILVLYLFVVMLLNVKREDHYHRQLLIGLVLGAALFVEVLILTFREELGLGTVASRPQAQVSGNTESIGEVLYTTYLFPFEIASLILLVAMIGAVLLSKKGIVEAEDR